jgi:hypothetical protein
MAQTPVKLTTAITATPVIHIKTRVFTPFKYSGLTPLTIFLKQTHPLPGYVIER